MDSTFFIVENNIIKNKIVATPEYASQIRAKPYKNGKNIGDRYDDTLTNSELTERNKLLTAQVTALSERNEFLEDCIAEMAGQVYNY